MELGAPLIVCFATPPLHTAAEVGALTSLALSTCHLRVIYVATFVNLVSLDLSRNQLTGLATSGIERCVKLASINLSNNAITDAKAFDLLGLLPHLRDLDARGNPVARQANYRNHVLYTTRNAKPTNFAPGLRVLDGSNVTLAAKAAAVGAVEGRDAQQRYLWYILYTPQACVWVKGNVAVPDT